MRSWVLTRLLHWWLGQDSGKIPPRVNCRRGHNLKKIKKPGDRVITGCFQEDASVGGDIKLRLQSSGIRSCENAISKKGQYCNKLERLKLKI